MNKSNEIQALVGALLKVQAEMKPAPENDTNPFLHNKYANLGSVIETAQPLLVKNGLVISQSAFGTGGAVGVHTILMHTSGQWLEDEIQIMVGEEKGKSTAQVAGSIITYLRRYSYAAILGMYTEEDDDGNDPRKTSKKEPEKKAPEPESKKAPEPTRGTITPEQEKKLVELYAERHPVKEAGEAQKALDANLKANYGKTLLELSTEEAAKLISRMVADKAKTAERASR